MKPSEAFEGINSSLKQDNAVRPMTNKEKQLAEAIQLIAKNLHGHSLYHGEICKMDGIDKRINQILNEPEKDHGCLEDIYGNCYTCGKSMLEMIIAKETLDKIDKSNFSHKPNAKWALAEKDKQKEFELEHCDKCSQMTNHLDGVCQKCKETEPNETEEWGGWKIVDKMLDNSDANFMYPTSRCYQELYDFVMLQKQKAIAEERNKVLEMINKLRIEQSDDIDDPCNYYNRAIQDVINKLK